MQGMGGGYVAFVLAAKLLHPRPKAMGVEFSSVELMILLPLRSAKHH